MTEPGSEVRLVNCKAHTFKYCIYLFKLWHVCGRTSSSIFSFIQSIFLYFMAQAKIYFLPICSMTISALPSSIHPFDHVSRSLVL